MPIAEVGTGTGASSSYGTGVTVAYPGTLAASDLVVIVLRTEVSTVPNFVCTGFTRVFEDVDSQNSNTGVTVLIGTGFTGTGSFTITSSALASGDWVARTCTAWSGVDNYIIGTAYSQSPGGANFDIPSVTTTVADAVVLAVGGQTFTAAPRTFTPTFTAEASNDACFQASRSFASAGATGAVTVTNSAFVSAIALLIALQEPTAQYIPPPLPRPHHRALLIR